MIIKNVTVLNFSDLSIHKNVDLLIEGDRIKKISNYSGHSVKWPIK